MAFNPQQIFPIDLNPNKAVGVNLPFNGTSVFKPNFLTKDAIKNNLINFFLTNPGERYMNPSFGAGLRNFIFEQIIENNLDGLKETIEFQLKNYFPNVNINELNVLKQEDNNSITIELTYSITNTNISDNLEIQF